MQYFNNAGLPLQLVSSLDRLGFTTPTPIQSKAIPLAMEGRDILGSAQTGTGKTIAFGIPLIAHLIANPANGALILLPTRELAAQVSAALTDLLKGSKIGIALLIGGDSMGKQLAQLRSKPRLIIGTPGRVNDHLKRRTLSLRDTTFLVLDETDRMLDMGFGIQLDAIAKYLTAKRQTLMFSATLPSNILKLAEKYLNDPIRVAIGSVVSPAENVTQENVKLTEDEKYPRLLAELEERDGSVIIFVKTKRGADKLAKRLKASGYGSDALHGDLRQNVRQRVIENFRREKFRVLVATDVAARGLDIPHIMHVVNFDIPQCPEDYIHRIGRTARAGSKGAALNLLTSADNSKWRAIQIMLNPELKGTFKNEGGNKRGGNKKRKSFGGFGKRSGDNFYGEKRSGGRRFGGSSDGENRGRRFSSDSERPKRSFSSEGGETSERKFSPNSDRPKRTFSSEGGNSSERRFSKDGENRGRRFSNDSDRPKRSFSSSEGGNSERRFSKDGERPKRSFSPKGRDSSERRFSSNSDRPKRAFSSEGGASSERRFSKDGENRGRRFSNDSERPKRSFSSSEGGNSERRFSKDGATKPKRSFGGNGGKFNRPKRDY